MFFAFLAFSAFLRFFAFVHIHVVGEKMARMGRKMFISRKLPDNRLTNACLEKLEMLFLVNWLTKQQDKDYSLKRLRSS